MKVMKQAKNFGKMVDALEKFELNIDGTFYFGRYTTKKRSNKNIDIGIVLYGYQWSLPGESSKEEVRFMQTISAEQKDLLLKSLLSNAVEVFAEICPSDILEVIDNKSPAKPSQSSSKPNDKTQEDFEKFSEYLKKIAKNYSV